MTTVIVNVCVKPPAAAVIASVCVPEGVFAGPPEHPEIVASAMPAITASSIVKPRNLYRVRNRPSKPSGARSAHARPVLAPG